MITKQTFQIQKQIILIYKKNINLTTTKRNLKPILFE